VVPLKPAVVTLAFAAVAADSAVLTPVPIELSQSLPEKRAVVTFSRLHVFLLKLVLL
jgi:hypothetical protein